MRDHLFLRIFKISEVRHHADAWFFAIKIFKKIVVDDFFILYCGSLLYSISYGDVKKQSIFQTRLKTLF